MIACYVRVSRNHQNSEQQKEELRRWCNQRGYADDDIQWFVDHGISGDTLARPALTRLNKLVLSGKVDTVIVWKLDRLSRKLVSGLQLISHWLESGVRFVSTTQAFDFDGVIGKMVASLLLGFAEIEQQTRKERQRVGIERARKQGKYKGKAPGTLKKGIKLEDVRKLRLQGLTLNQMANALGCSPRSVSNYVSRL
jgi:DNA invertase Pin-like site-specific DNA recombinase